MDWGRKARIEREAAEWVVLIDSPAFDGFAAARCRSWLSRSEDHRRAFHIAQSAWTAAGRANLRTVTPPQPTALSPFQHAPAPKTPTEEFMANTLQGANGVH